MLFTSPLLPTNKFFAEIWEGGGNNEKNDNRGIEFMDPLGARLNDLF